MKKNKLKNSTTNYAKKEKYANPFVFVRVCSWLIFLLLLSACYKQTNAKDGLLIALSIQPQTWFVSQIAGDKAVSTLTFLPPGQNQHTFEPTPRQIQTLASADAWILSGAEFEIGLRPKVEKVFPNLLIVDGAEGVRYRLITEEESGGIHTSLELDRHTWLGREPAKILASHVRDTFCLFDKKNADYYNKQYELVAAVIDEEFKSLEITLAPLRGKNIFVYHPCFGYFFDEFGIKQSAVEVSGKEPTPRELNNLVNKIKEGQAVAIIVQTQFPTGAAKTLAASTGLEIISLDPFATDWLNNLQQIGNALTRCIR